MIVTIVSQIGSNLLASSPLRPSGLSLWGWQRIHCQGKLSLLGLPRPLLLNDNNPFSNAGARQPRLQVPQLPLQQRRHREGGQAVHGRQRDKSGGWYPLETQAKDSHISLTQVGGTTSQKVWVFTLEEEDPSSQGIVTDLLVKMTRPRLFKLSFQMKI